jgi:ATP-dependent Clp protease adaptor protein ClpS
MTGRGGTLAPERVIEPIESELVDTARPWNVVVWNDPINLMSYVVFVFRKVFGHSKARATKLMLQVHHEGRAIVSSGPLEQAEIDAATMHSYGLWATLEQP